MGIARLVAFLVAALLAHAAHGGMIKKHARRAREPVREERRCNSVGGWCKCSCVADKDNGPGERRVEFRVRHGSSLRCGEDGAGFDVTFGELRACECTSDTHVHHDARHQEFRQN